ncbi:TfoX/Sxy family DNA transformation protein [Vibrio sp. YMD68]|uniref:TfoX/Sxy family DNA transformation protein n=1 Tax=Vibrio sp. YMD68 TaxID=3042300 RepID=UPI00249CDE81|nr:TfoX/Sxy family DNA transformation protein [Vibrio sp. YMD68]WGW01490.1 TfoX/Sxy family DNA transformation protein [Vibrio sp. YMD68]
MDKPILKDSMRLFEQLGRVKSRSMFGGFGIFVEDTMFALVVNDKLHIRADSIAVKKFKQQGYMPYVYKKRGHPVVTKYYALPDDWMSDSAATLAEAKSSLEIAKKEKESQASAKPDRLKDLPNLRLATERMLKKAGIDSVATLEEQGSVAAYKAIQQSHPSDVGLELLWALEGAIKGTHWSVIPQERREELANRLR